MQMSQKKRKLVQIQEANKTSIHLLHTIHPICTHTLWCLITCLHLTCTNIIIHHLICLLVATLIHLILFHTIVIIRSHLLSLMRNTILKIIIKCRQILKRKVLTFRSQKAKVQVLTVKMLSKKGKRERVGQHMLIIICMHIHLHILDTLGILHLVIWCILLNTMILETKVGLEKESMDLEYVIN